MKHGIVTLPVPDKYEFRPCRGFPNYMVNREGEIRNAKTGKLISVGSDGLVQLRKDGKYWRRSPRILRNIAFPTHFKEAVEPIFGEKESNP